MLVGGRLTTAINALISWWLNQPIWNVCVSQIGSCPQIEVKIKKCFSGEISFREGNDEDVMHSLSGCWSTCIIFPWTLWRYTPTETVTCPLKDSELEDKPFLLKRPLLGWLTFIFRGWNSLLKNGCFPATRWSPTSYKWRYSGITPISRVT